MLLNDRGRARPLDDGTRMIGDAERSAASWDLSGWDEDCTFLPQPDELVVLTSAPGRLAEVISVRTGAPRPRGIPGLRLLSRHPHGLWFRFWHPPTRALVQVRSRELPITRPYVTASRVPQAGSSASAYAKLDDVEHGALRVLTHIHPQAQNLLAAMLVRLPRTDLLGSDAPIVAPVGQWYSLSGRGVTWTMRGTSEIAAAGVAAALTDPHAGLTGAEIVNYTNGAITVRCGWGTLQLVGGKD